MLKLRFTKLRLAAAGKALLLGAFLPLSACSHAIHGGEAVVAIPVEPDSLNPALARTAASNDVICLLFRGLVRFDEHGVVVADLAQEVPSTENGGISRDGRVLTYHLRHGLRWQDGVTLTSADVRFTWKILMDRHNEVPSRSGYDRIEDVQTPDPQTVRVVLREPYAPALTLFANSKQGAILPQHVLDGTRDVNHARFNEMPVGSGPYRLVRWERGNVLIFEPNVYAQKPGRFARLSLRVVPDSGAAINTLLAGEIDAAIRIPPAESASLGKRPGIYVTSSPSFHWEHLTFNTCAGSGPQSNIHVRRAIAYAIDPAMIQRTVFRTSIRQAPLDQPPGSSFRASDVIYYSYDLTRARAELRAAAITNPHIVLLSASGSTAGTQIELEVQAMLAKIGIRTEIKNVPPEILLGPPFASDSVASNRFQVALFTTVTPVPDPDDSLYVASWNQPPHGWDIGCYRNPFVDALERRALAEYNPERRRETYAKIQRFLIKDLPFYTVAWPPEVTATNKRLSFVHAVPFGSSLQTLAQL